MKSTDFKFNSSVEFSESYAVKYWDRSGEFVKQQTILVYTRSKNKSEQVSRFVQKEFRLRPGAIISVKYQ